MKESIKFSTFKEFYHFYLREHSNLMCRKLHFIGTSLIISLILTVFATGNFKLIFFMPVIGYGFAWVGHFVFEKNKPATFKYPLLSLVADFVMFWDILTGKIRAF